MKKGYEVKQVTIVREKEMKAAWILASNSEIKTGEIIHFKLKNDLVVSGSTDNTIRVWDLNDGRCVKIFEGHTDSIATLTTLKNRHIISGSWDKTLREWILAPSYLLSLTALVNQQDFEVLRQTFMKENIWHVPYLS